MIPVLVDGVKKYLLTEEEVDAKISASGGGSSSEISLASITTLIKSKFPPSTVRTGPVLFAGSTYSAGMLPTACEELDNWCVIFQDGSLYRCTLGENGSYAWDKRGTITYTTAGSDAPTKPGSPSLG